MYMLIFLKQENLLVKRVADILYVQRLFGQEKIKSFATCMQ